MALAPRVCCFGGSAVEGPFLPACEVQVAAQGRERNLPAARKVPAEAALALDVLSGFVSASVGRHRVEPGASRSNLKQSAL